MSIRQYIIKLQCVWCAIQHTQTSVIMTNTDSRSHIQAGSSTFRLASGGVCRRVLFVVTLNGREHFRSTAISIVLSLSSQSTQLCRSSHSNFMCFTGVSIGISRCSESQPDDKTRHTTLSGVHQRHLIRRARRRNPTRIRRHRHREQRGAETRQETARAGAQLPRDEHALASATVQMVAEHVEGQGGHAVRVPVHAAHHDFLLCFVVRLFAQTIP
mmetsp:Transcript_5547/g.9284  ORF Transcript_5547/g.9284 Transcript_5547/m.9284 type:complete len:215 (+) Transcript_5547:445-1089(+)